VDIVTRRFNFTQGFVVSVDGVFALWVENLLDHGREHLQLVREESEVKVYPVKRKINKNSSKK
jgi:hypothetical protein